MRWAEGKRTEDGLAHLAHENWLIAQWIRAPLYKRWMPRLDSW